MLILLDWLPPSFVYKHAAAAAKSLQSCPTLCNPIDSSPTGSPVPGILQARILEWVAISFSNAWKWKVKVKSLSRVRLLATPWTAAYQAPPSIGFSRQEYWSGVPLPSPSLYVTRIYMGLPRWVSGKESTRQCRRHRRPAFNTWEDHMEKEVETYSSILLLENFMDREAWQTTVHWGCKELDTAKHVCAHIHTHNIYDIFFFKSD